MNKKGVETPLEVLIITSISLIVLIILSIIYLLNNGYLNDGYLAPAIPSICNAPNTTCNYQTECQKGNPSYIEVNKTPYYNYNGDKYVGCTTEANGKLDGFIDPNNNAKPLILITNKPGFKCSSIEIIPKVCRLKKIDDYDCKTIFTNILKDYSFDTLSGKFRDAGLPSETVMPLNKIVNYYETRCGNVTG